MQARRLSWWPIGRSRGRPLSGSSFRGSMCLCGGKRAGDRSAWSQQEQRATRLWRSSSGLLGAWRRRMPIPECSRSGSGTPMPARSCRWPHWPNRPPCLHRSLLWRFEVENDSHAKSFSCVGSSVGFRGFFVPGLGRRLSSVSLKRRPSLYRRQARWTISESWRA